MVRLYSDFGHRQFNFSHERGRKIRLPLPKVNPSLAGAGVAVLALLSVTPPTLSAQTRFFPDVPAFELPLASPRVNGLAGRMFKATRGDNQFGAEREAEVTVGEDFPAIGIRGGERPINLGFGALVYARFSLDDAKSSMISNDWQVGFNLHADLRPWELALQLYHESSHLGDEYAATFSAKRIDWTREVLAAWVGYRAGRFRVMASGGYFPIDELDLSRWGASVGVDFQGAEFVFIGQRMRPLAGFFTEGASATSWRLSTSAKVGIAFPGMKAGKEFSLSFIAHDGLSTQRQFFRKDLRYFGLELGFQL